MGVFPSIVVPAPVLPGSESGVLRIGCLNVRGYNEVEKRALIGSMFEEYKLDILGLSETKLRGEGALSFGGVRGFKSGAGRRRKCEGGGSSSDE